MKRLLLFLIGKFINWISPILWRMPYRWAFNLHQWLGNKAMILYRKYKVKIL